MNLLGLSTCALARRSVLQPVLAVILCINGAGVCQAGQSPERAQEAESGTRKSITGRIVTESGQPLPRAAVMALPVFLGDQRAWSRSLLGGVATDSDGRFQVEDLLPGSYTIQVLAPGYVMEEGERVIYRPGDTARLVAVKGGVITGRVTSYGGEPVVGIRVQAVRVPDKKRHLARGSGYGMAELMAVNSGIGPGWVTDDRGIYRIFGLAPGTYLVSAGGQLLGSGWGEGYGGEAPTYYPSSTPDTAVEVPVRAGEVVSGVDIGYRDERGHSISGILKGLPPGAGATLILTGADTGMFHGMTYKMGGDKDSFQFDGILRGQYEIVAQAASGSRAGIDAGLFSEPHRVSVTAGDVTGIEIVLAPMASVEGRAVRGPVAAEADECRIKPSWHLEEVLLKPISSGRSVSPGLMSAFSGAAPDSGGVFNIRYLKADNYNLKVSLPDDRLFVDSVTLPAAKPADPPRDAMRDGFALKAGEKLQGLTITIREGAGGIKGRVVSARPGTPLPSAISVHLVPEEKSSADALLRYFESAATSDGTFSVGNLPPGRYWVFAREAEESGSERPLAWDPIQRAGLRFEGEASRRVIEAKPCGSIADLVLTFTPLQPPSAPSGIRSPSRPHNRQ